MQKFILILVSLFMVSCEAITNVYEKDVFVCTTTEKEVVRQFVGSSIKNANNMSDEEMEDVVHQLQITAVQLTCNRMKVKQHYNSNTGIDFLEGVPDSLTAYEY